MITRPFMLKNGTWIEISKYSSSSNASFCDFTFLVPADPIIAFMQRH